MCAKETKGGKCTVDVHTLKDRLEVAQVQMQIKLVFNCYMALDLCGYLVSNLI